jgi:hypothetical protein
MYLGKGIGTNKTEYSGESRNRNLQKQPTARGCSMSLLHHMGLTIRYSHAEQLQLSFIFSAKVSQNES